MIVEDNFNQSLDSKVVKWIESLWFLAIPTLDAEATRVRETAIAATALKRALQLRKRNLVLSQREGESG